MTYFNVGDTCVGNGLREAFSEALEKIVSDIQDIDVDEMVRHAEASMVDEVQSIVDDNRDCDSCREEGFSAGYEAASEELESRAEEAEEKLAEIVDAINELDPSFLDMEAHRDDPVRAWHLRRELLKLLGMNVELSNENRLLMKDWFPTQNAS